MPRRSHGLQIAVIIYALLTMILATTTFVYFKQSQKAEVKAQVAEEEAVRQQVAARQVGSENAELKRLMGFDPGDAMEAIRAGFQRDMEACASQLGKLPSGQRSYRAAVARLCGGAGGPSTR